MIVSLEHPQRVILHQIKLLLAVLLVVHQRDTRITRRDDAQRQDGHLGRWGRRRRPGRGLGCIRLRYGGRDGDVDLQEAASWHPALLAHVRIDDAGTGWITVDDPPAPFSREDHKGVAARGKGLRFTGAGRESQGHVHHHIKLVILLSHVRVNSYGV